MKDFLMMLLFAKSVLLTPQPIDLYGVIEIKPNKPLKAITSGAHLSIDISKGIVDIQEMLRMGILERQKKIKQLVPSRTIKAELYSGKNQPTVFYYDGNFMYTNTSIFLTLDSNLEVPTDVEFDKVILTSNIKLNQVTITWVNFAK